MSTLYKILRAGNTGHKGGQYGNDNAAGAHRRLELLPDYRESYVDNDKLIEQAHKWGAIANELKAYATDYANSLSTDQKKAIISYTLNQYKPINNYLRSGDMRNGQYTGDIDLPTQGHLNDQIAAMMSAFKPLPVDMVVWRGMRHAGSLQKGGAIDKGFVSTSLDQSIGVSFTKMQETDDKALVRMVLPAGTPAILTSGLSNEDTTDTSPELEVILPPGARFIVQGKPVPFSDPSNPAYGNMHIYNVSVRTPR